MPGRVSSSARKLTLHLPARWPWAEEFDHMRALEERGHRHRQEFGYSGVGHNPVFPATLTNVRSVNLVT